MLLFKEIKLYLHHNGVLLLCHLQLFAFNFMQLPIEWWQEWAIPEKIQIGRGGLRTYMDFPGILKKKHVKISGVN